MLREVHIHPFNIKVSPILAIQIGFAGHLCEQVACSVCLFIFGKSIHMGRYLGSLDVVCEDGIVCFAKVQAWVNTLHISDSIFLKLDVSVYL